MATQTKPKTTGGTSAPVQKPSAVKAAEKEAVKDSKSENAPGNPKPASQLEANTPGPTVSSKPQIQVDQYTRRSDKDVLTHGFALVSKGDHEGRYCTLTGTVTREKDGWPIDVQVRFRDSAAEIATVPYKDLEPVDRPAR